jgi:hypothetical protein
MRSLSGMHMLMRMTMLAHDGVVPEWTLADRLRKARLMIDLEGQELTSNTGDTNQYHHGLAPVHELHPRGRR